MDIPNKVFFCTECGFASAFTHEGVICEATNERRCSLEAGRLYETLEWALSEDKGKLTDYGKQLLDAVVERENAKSIQSSDVTDSPSTEGI